MSQRNLHKRAKMGHLPGDLSVQTKARMLESRKPFFVFPWQRISQRCISGFRHDQRQRARAKFKRRMDREVEDGLL